MTLRAILASIVIAGSVFAVNAEKAKSTRSMHSKIHQEQLANVKKSGMDATVINKMLKEDIDKRESAVLDKMSSESSKMIDDLLKEANKHIGKHVCLHHPVSSARMQAAPLYKGAVDFEIIL